ncbi:MAG: hypothetical protein RIS52_2176 [Pseudomonadota bacterium]|jgi:hypothetical protein
MVSGAMQARLLIAALALCFCGPLLAQGPLAAKGRDIFVLPRDYSVGTFCDGRFGFKADPRFGEGLTARYYFRKDPAFEGEIGFSEPPLGGLATEKIGLERAADGKATIIVTDPYVIRTHDDMIARFATICATLNAAGQALIDIEYDHASPKARRDSPVKEPQEGETLPVSFGRRDLAFLPHPVAGGMIAFENWPAYYSGKNWLSIKPVFGAGLQSFYVFEGRQPANYQPTFVGKMASDGFTVLSVDLDGKSVLLIADTQVISTREHMLKRAEIIRELEFGQLLKLERIVYYPAGKGGIDDLRLPLNIRSELHRQHRVAMQNYRQELAELAEAMPEDYEIEALIARDWSHFEDDTTGPGYETEFGVKNAQFGELRDFRCTRMKVVFTCTIGVTYLENGRPKYGQREIQFTRDPANDFKLIRSHEDFILAN